MSSRRAGCIVFSQTSSRMMAVSALCPPSCFPLAATGLTSAMAGLWGEAGQHEETCLSSCPCDGNTVLERSEQSWSPGEMQTGHLEVQVGLWRNTVCSSQRGDWVHLSGATKIVVICFFSFEADQPVTACLWMGKAPLLSCVPWGIGEDGGGKRPGHFSWGLC